MIANALKDIIVPGKIGNYYVVPQRILGFDITKTTVRATQVYLNARTVSIEKIYEEKLEKEDLSYPERVTQAIKAIMAKAERVDAIRSSLTSSNVIFKDLTLPFSDTQKIAMVINYEIEPFLPFAINQALIDFIIVSSDAVKKTSKILVAAVKKETVAEHKALFENAGVNVSDITIDLFDLYGLYNIIPTYSKLPDAVALIDIEFSTTRIAYIINGQLTFVRSIPMGLAQWAKAMSKQLGITPNEAFEKIIRFGLEKYDDKEYSDAIAKPLQELMQELQFTLTSFAGRSENHPLTKILLLGAGADVAGIAHVVEQKLHAPCVLFEINHVFTNSAIVNKTQQRIPSAFILSLSTALPTPTMQEFNLLQQEFAPSTETLFIKQLITALGLVILLLGSLIAHSYWQTYRLKKAAASSTAQVIQKLNTLGLNPANKRTLTEALRDAEEEVDKQEEIWFAFSIASRFSFLKHLYDLSLAVDRKSIGLNLTKLVLDGKNNTLELEGEVKDFDALATFERELQESKMFVSVPSQDLRMTKFSITLLLKKDGDDIT